MPRKRQEVAQQLADRLFAVEEAIDVALLRAAELTAAMPAARSAAGLSAIVGQDAVESAAGMVSAIVQARQQAVATHLRLDATRSTIKGLEIWDFGSSGGKPPSADTRHLRVVNAA